MSIRHRNRLSAARFGDLRTFVDPVISRDRRDFTPRGFACSMSDRPGKTTFTTSADNRDELWISREAAEVAAELLNDSFGMSVDLCRVDRKEERRQAILKAFEHSPAMGDSDIAVTSTDSEVVLTGTVRLSLQKRLATAIAQHCGARNIRNDISVLRSV